MRIFFTYIDNLTNKMHELMQLVQAKYRRRITSWKEIKLNELATQEPSFCNLTIPGGGYISQQLETIRLDCPKPET